MARVLIAGCGYVGTALGRLLAESGDVVWGLRRSPASLPPSIRPIEADLSVPATLRDLPRDLDFVFYAASPGGSDDLLYRSAYVDGLRNLLQALEAAGENPSRIFFVSSTAVYGQSQGEWVDETSETKPEGFAGNRLLEAEKTLMGGPFPATVIRLGGIYGPGRNRLIERVRSAQATYREDPPQFTNRIHRDDCAGALAHLMRCPDPAELYLGVDDEPADERTVMHWLAGALGAPVPRRAEGPEQTRRTRGNKRCRNALLRGSGYVFRYPTFREGYTEVIADLP